MIFQMSGKIPEQIQENVRDISRTFPGNFREKSAKCYAILELERLLEVIPSEITQWNKEINFITTNAFNYQIFPTFLTIRNLKSHFSHPISAFSLKSQYSYSEANLQSAVLQLH